MPLYEYACRSCGRQFEYLTRAGQAPACPACLGSDLDKLQSVFAVNTADGRREPAPFPASGGCGRCGDPRGPGSCSIN